MAKINSEMAQALRDIGIAGLGTAGLVMAVPIVAGIGHSAYRTVTGGPGQFVMQGLGSYQLWKQRKSLEGIKADTQGINQLNDTAVKANQNLGNIGDEIAAVAAHDNAGLPGSYLPRGFGIPNYSPTPDQQRSDSYRQMMMTGIGRRGHNGNPYIVR